ncbi:MAG TPA: SRPBCC domain-containing protein [Polyangiaceae bacterium]|jgi:uncharacterized protein YndB with AHSA1/START domain
MSVVLVVRRTIRADAETLFRAWTEPEQLRAWWGPRPVVCVGASVDLRVGGRYRIENGLPSGGVVVLEGEFLAIDAPRALSYTWRMGDDPESIVRVRFEPRGAETEVIVTHEQIADERVRDSHAAGWSGCLDGLERHFSR